MPTELPPPPQLERTLEILRVMAHADRLTVLIALGQQPALSVTALTALCGVAQPTMSHHLRVLRDAGLVATQRAGRRVLYALADRHVLHIIDNALEHAAHLAETG
jgi:ArsR family transcriptional regulator, zinc-responsive transcriptional repressor